jgi:signal peptidase I
MEPQEPPRKRRSPWLAGLGNLFFPPLGHVYAGQPGRGLLLFAGVTAIEVMAFWVAARSVGMGPVVLALSLSLAGLLWRIVDAVLVARWKGNAPLWWYQRWYFYLVTMVLSYGFGMVTIPIITTYMAQTYYIPSGAMIPTLTFHDRILVDKLTYRWKDLARDDVVVFRAPPQASPEEHEFVKRVIGLPGETVAVVPDTLLVDGKPAVELNDSVGDPNANFQHTLQPGLRWLDREQSPRVQNNALLQNGEPRVVVTPSGQADLREGQLWVNGQQLASAGSRERLRAAHDLASFGAAPGVQGSVYSRKGSDDEEADQPALIVLKGKRLTLRPGWVSINGQPLKEPYARQSPRYEMPPFRIPTGYYFVLGDNRNDSNDSHAWGPVSRKRISGVTHMIFWSDQPERIGRPL